MGRPVGLLSVGAATAALFVGGYALPAQAAQAESYSHYVNCGTGAYIQTNTFTNTYGGGYTVTTTNHQVWGHC